jgi:hypothetical protein
MRNKRHLRSSGAFDMLEVALGLLIALLISGAMVAAYTVANNNNKVDKAELEASTIASSVHQLKSMNRDYSAMTTEVVANSGTLPAGWVTESSSFSLGDGSGASINLPGSFAVTDNQPHYAVLNTGSGGVVKIPSGYVVSYSEGDGVGASMPTGAVNFGQGNIAISDPNNPNAYPVMMICSCSVSFDSQTNSFTMGPGNFYLSTPSASDAVNTGQAIIYDPYSHGSITVTPVTK